MAHHQLHEWEARRFDAPDAIPEGEAERLVRAARAPAARLKGNQNAFEFRRDALRAQNLVGVVAAPGVTCEILPKVDRDAPDDALSLRRRLIRMLAVAHDLPVADDAATALGVQNETLLEILIGRFARELNESVRRGMPRAYLAHADDLPALRGRLDVTRQFTTLAASPQRLACRYDEFSRDVPINQVMLAAVTRLHRLARTSANQRALAELRLLYDEVTAVPPSRLRWDAIVPDRANARWRRPLGLARLILGDRFQNSAHGDADGFALLFDMNALFERYAEKLLGGLAPEFGWRLEAQGGRLPCLWPEEGGAGLFETAPDIRLIGADGVAIVIDAKWKRLSPPTAADRKLGIAQADLYQLMAYAQLYRCDRIALLYPHHAGLPTGLLARHRVARPDGPVRLTVATVDLANNDTARASIRALLGDVER